MRSLILEQAGLESVETFKALASEMRVKILLLLADTDLNINELGQALGIAQPTVTKHVNILEAVGLVRSDYSPGVQGMQKRCRLGYDRISVSFEGTQVPALRVEETEMPIGMYTRAEVTSTCGLANGERMIGLADEPQAFFFPDRSTAQLLWMSQGFVEYVFPNTLPTSVDIRRLELSMEVCSEAPDFNIDYPSDITVWVNGVELGCWTSPGDMGGKRGRLNPAWWNDHGTQYGLLKIWSVDSSGSYVDGKRISRRTMDDIQVFPQQTVTVRIGVRPDAEHVGGFNLFGRGFGNYEQDLLLRLHYSPRQMQMTLAEEQTSDLQPVPAYPGGE